MQGIVKCAWVMMVCGPLLAVSSLLAEEAKSPVKPDAAAAEPPAAKPVLSPEMVAIRDRVRHVLDAYVHQPVNTGENTPGEVMLFCLAFGTSAEIRYASAAGSAMNGIGALSWNIPCAGYQLLAADNGHVLARVGYGLQERPSQLLAVLALCGVPADYEIRLDTRRKKVADLVEFEKLECEAGGDLSLKLVGLQFYAGSDTWQNRLGQTWSVEQIVDSELKRSAAGDDAAALDRLMGLSAALDRQVRAGKPLGGPYERAEKYTAECQRHALENQAGGGYWNPGIFTGKSEKSDPAGVLRTTGRTLEWLTLSLSESRLQEPAVVRSVDLLTRTLEGPYAQWNITRTSPREISSVMHALAGLRRYDRRVFKPADPKRPESEAKKPDAASKQPEAAPKAPAEKDGKSAARSTAQRRSRM
jgi:hypothetical protein